MGVDVEVEVRVELRLEVKVEVVVESRFHMLAVTNPRRRVRRYITIRMLGRMYTDKEGCGLS